MNRDNMGSIRHGGSRTLRTEEGEYQKGRINGFETYNTIVRD
jgi:hypothetical protein